MTSSSNSRRRFLTTTVTSLGISGMGLTLWPFVMSMNPSARAKASGAPVEVDISKLEFGQLLTVAWRGRPVWILRRSPEQLQRLEAFPPDQLRDPMSAVSAQQPNYAKNVFRSTDPEWLIAVGVCTHLGCTPTYRPELSPEDLGAGWVGGFFCPCHGSRFDLAGRVFAGVPAPRNLEIPPYRFLKSRLVEIGTHPDSYA